MSVRVVLFFFNFKIIFCVSYQGRLFAVIGEQSRFLKAIPVRKRQLKTQRTNKQKTHKSQLYVCKECSFTCLRENSFQEHCRVVHKKPILACKLCHYVALRRGHLTAHINGVHFRKLLFCSHCKFSTVWNASLTKHKKRCHSINSFE